MSVSRLASAPHFGHLTLTNSSTAARGDSKSSVCSKFSICGKVKGSSLSSTATAPQFLQ